VAAKIVPPLLGIGNESRLPLPVSVTSSELMIGSIQCLRTLYSEAVQGTVDRMSSHVHVLLRQHELQPGTIFFLKITHYFSNGQEISLMLTTYKVRYFCKMTPNKGGSKCSEKCA